MSVPTHEQHNETPTSTGHQRHTVRNVIIGIVAAVVILPILALGLLYLGIVVTEERRPSVGDAFVATERYYQAVQRQDYPTAYSSLDQHATMTLNGTPVVIDSAATLPSVAKSLDQQYGLITAYALTDGNFEMGKDLVDETVRVTRASHEYDVHIQIEWVGGNQLLVDKTKWRILHTDGL